MYRQKRIITHIGDTYENITNNKIIKHHNNVSVLRHMNPYKNNVPHRVNYHLILDITEEEVIINNKTSYNIIANVIEINNK
jgi:hypothetical protein